MLKREEFFDKKVLKGLERIESILLNPNFREEMDPLFFYYFRGILNRGGLRKYYMDTAVIFELLNAKGKDILEVGCGFGLRLILMTLMGAKKTVGIDISEEMIEGFRKLIKRFPNLNIETKKGDFLLTHYSSNSFDIVLLIEAISHIRDTKLLLDKVQEVLRPGGILFVRDGNNDLFLPTRIRIRRGWKRSEKGPIDEKMAIYGCEVDKLCFFDARMKIIRNFYPSLDNKTIKMIAKKTQGMWGEEIKKATLEFISTGKVTNMASFPYRNPYTGEYPELGFNPLKLKNDLEKRGFQCRFLSPTIHSTDHNASWRDRILSLINIIYSRFPKRLLPFIWPSFQIIAIKE